MRRPAVAGSRARFCSHSDASSQVCEGQYGQAPTVVPSSMSDLLVWAEWSSVVSRPAMEELGHAIVLNRMETLLETPSPTFYSPTLRPMPYDPYGPWTFEDEADSVWVDMKVEFEKSQKTIHLTSDDMAEIVLQVRVRHAPRPPPRALSFDLFR